MAKYARFCLLLLILIFNIVELSWWHMLVCHCHAVNEKTIAQCVRAGARDQEEIGDVCGAGTSCGGCRPVIEELIDENTSPKKRSLLPLLAAASF